MDENANGVRVGCIGVSAIYVPLEKLGIMPFDVLRGDDDLDLC